MSYSIMNWNVINNSCKNLQPVIYFKPNIDVMLKKENNNNKFLIEIEGTGGVYDGKVIATLDQSQPNTNNVCDPTGLFIMILDVKWALYPKSNGTFKILEHNSC